MTELIGSFFTQVIPYIIRCHSLLVLLLCYVNLFKELFFRCFQIVTVAVFLKSECKGIAFPQYRKTFTRKNEKIMQCFRFV